MMVEYEGVPCPAEGCEGYLKHVNWEGNTRIQCERGHLLEREQPVSCPVPHCQGFLRFVEDEMVECDYGHLVDEKT